MAHLKLFLFGPPRIERGGQRIEIGLNKSTALLVYLAVTKQTLSRDTLATLFWPDVDQRTALGNLRRALYRVNRALHEDVLSTTRKTAELNPQADIWLDSEEFQQIVEACPPTPAATQGPDTECTQRLTKAAELYTDHFLTGFTLPDCPAFDEWQFFQAESLHRSLSKVLEQLVHSHQAQAGWEQAITYARRWVALDPLEEPAQRCLMELYARSNHQAAALRQYGECRRVLDEELGVPPGDETTALYEAIKCRQIYAPKEANTGVTLSDVVAVPGLRQKSLHGEFRTVNEKGGSNSGEEHAPNGSTDSADQADDVRIVREVTSPGPPHNLPAQPNPFFGRTEELAEIRRLLVDDACCRLATVIGPGGIGKTRLAMEAAYGIVRTFVDGVYFIPLAPHSSAGHIVSTVAEQLGLNFYESSAAKQQLLDYLRNKRMLLIMDNFEHLLSGTELVAEILQIAPEAKILVTSQERLNLSGEAVYVLGGMSFPEHGSPEDVREYDAVQLLVHCARLARPGIALQARDYPHMARICRLVQGMPLALVLAAGWLEVLSFKEIADEIAQSLDFLNGHMRDLPERQRSVRAAFEYSWKRLPAADQQAFSQLSVFRGGFTRQAAQRVAGANLRTLRTLVGKSLISIRQDTRYEIHKLLRQYGEEQLEASSEAARIRDLHSDYYLALLSQHEADLKGGQQFEALDAIDADLDNIRAAWDWALGRKNEKAINQVVESLYLFFTFRSRYQESLEFFNTARQELAPCPEDEPAPTCRRVLARLAWLQSLDPKAHKEIEANFHKCLTLAQKHGDRVEVAFCLFQLGCYHRMVKRDPATAVRFLEQSLEHYQALNDSFYMAIALHWLGSCHAVVTNLDNFISFTRQSLELARETGNKAIIPYDLRNLTLGALCSGDYTAAQGYCQDALIIDAEMGLHIGLAESKSLLGLIHLLQGDVNPARALTEEGLEMARKIGFPATIGHALAVLSLVKAISGDSAGGQQMGNESLEVPSTFFGRILANWGLSIASCDLEQHDKAWQYVREALKHAHRLSLPAVMIWPLPVAALILAHRGGSVRAVELLSLAFNHPMNPGGCMERWGRLTMLRTELQAKLGTQAYQAAWERGKGLDMGTVVAELLAD
ncbi:MAG: BTAD domain-containing putative transcriptional regulator [Anaerolineae bacterium]|jgi:predicted ATPase/DNA-binding SARP family transcriptional activator